MKSRFFELYIKVRKIGFLNSLDIILRRFLINFKLIKSYNIHSNAVVERKSLVKIGANSEIKDYVIIRTFRKKVIIGKNCQVNPFTVIYGGSGVCIGNDVMIAPHCMLAAGNHDFKQLEKPMRFAANISKGPILIEDDVWIGANSTITDGVTIGKGAVVAANSVVNKSVNKYDIVAGNPIKVIGSRLKLVRN